MEISSGSNFFAEKQEQEMTSLSKLRSTFQSPHSASVAYENVLPSIPCFAQAHLFAN
jgi:hypothetical protein